MFFIILNVGVDLGLFVFCAVSHCVNIDKNHDSSGRIVEICEFNRLNHRLHIIIAFCIANPISSSSRIVIALRNEANTVINEWYNTAQIVEWYNGCDIDSSGD